MSFATEHKRLAPVLLQAREFDIATNPDPLALFEAGGAGFQIWCTPEDHPAGWKGIAMNAGAFAKPCSYVASISWGWGVGKNEGKITHLTLSTQAYALADQKPDKFTRHNYTRFPVPAGEQEPIANRPADLRWAEKKIRWLFKQAGVPCPDIRTTKEA